MRAIIPLAICLLFGQASASAEDFFLKDGDRVVFLGDSITADGKYIAYIDGYLRTRFPEEQFHLMNLGLPSETVSGLSEPDHPWPRPNVHERLGRVIEKLDFNVAVVCYGMNDGIYYPFSEERLAAYQKGIAELVEKLKPTGARLVLMTPPAFDAASVKSSNLLPLGAPKYSWMKTYADYNDVMKRYADWLMTQGDEVDRVIDLHTPTTEILRKRHAIEEGWRSGDGVHPTPSGHIPIALAVLAAMGAPAEIDALMVTMADGRGSGAIQIDWGSRVPMPSDESWDAKLVGLSGLDETLN
jgi:lysophospholipase L1-like esterase